MSIFKYILIIFFLIISKVDANTKIVFIDIDYLINNSSIGKSTLNKLDEINSKNLKILDDNEKKLRDLEEQIKNKKNVISEEELKKEIEDFKKKVNIYNLEKKNYTEEFKKTQAVELNKLLDKFNSIINDHISANSIDIVLNKKNLYMGKLSSDITNEILKKINNQFQ